MSGRRALAGQSSLESFKLICDQHEVPAEVLASRARCIWAQANYGKARLNPKLKRADCGVKRPRSKDVDGCVTESQFIKTRRRQIDERVAEDPRPNSLHEEINADELPNEPSMLRGAMFITKKNLVPESMQFWQMK